MTNLLSAIPYLGEMIVQWVWGGFSVSEPTLVRFFTIHFLLPFVILLLSVVHIFLLHSSGSSNPLGVDQNSDKVFFHPFFIVKDLLGLFFFFSLIFFVSIMYYDVFMDPDNSSPANPLSTPPHIKPEWYFLFAYAILRSIPNKLGGVIALLLSVLGLLFLSLNSKKSWKLQFSISHKFIVVSFFCSFWLLTWVGGMPVEYPLTLIGQLVSVFYFMVIIYLSW
nr:cytochrome b [Osculotes curta]